VINLRAFNSNNQNDNKVMEKQIQDIKIEYYKYKNNLNNVMETHKNLKSRFDKEKSKGGVESLNNTLNCMYFLI
jgi:hypothetical protein